MDAMKYYGYKVYVADEDDKYDDGYYDRGVIVAYDYSDAAHKLEVDYEGTSETLFDIYLYELAEVSDRFSVYDFLSEATGKEALRRELESWHLI